LYEAQAAHVVVHARLLRWKLLQGRA
jgi:hypothetical protein